MKNDYGVVGEPPWLHRVTASESALCDISLRINRLADSGAVCRVIRGAKARSSQSLFDEFAAALQFPYYFGENWNAFDECMSDLDWLPGIGYLILISNAVQVLRDEPPESFRAFVETLDRIAEERIKVPSNVIAGDEPKPLHVIFHSNRGDAAALDMKMKAAGVSFDFVPKEFVDGED
jgi:Barstar (barnase inhibitor)